MQKGRFFAPTKKEFAVIFHTLTFKERFFAYILLLITSVSLLFFITALSRHFSVEVPTSGGSLSEGLIGTPRFINPTLAFSQTDKDIASLVYSGLLRIDEKGGFLDDLASSHETSSDGLVYTFHLKPNLVWQDGEPITSDDVAFTIDKIQDETLNSPHRAAWIDVRVDTPDKDTVRFILKQPYAPFIENTTVGILPKHIWTNVSRDQFALVDSNVMAIGSGPYRIKKIYRSKSGIPEQYVLESFEHFALGKPYINTLKLHFYQNEEELVGAYENGEIECMSGISPSVAKVLSDRGVLVVRTILPRVFGLFFNQNQATIFTDSEVRKALAEAINKDQIITSVLHGFAQKADGPLPTLIAENASNLQATSTEGSALERLAKAGWKRNESTGLLERKVRNETRTLGFSIATLNAPELVAVANALAGTWQRIGVQVKVQLFEEGDLKENVIRERIYDTLLFGEVIGRTPDPYAFWHSSQRQDVGLNIAMYTNSKVDTLLDQARSTTNSTDRAEKLKQFEQAIKNDTPAIFLYTPELLYVVPHSLHGVQLGLVGDPEDRFAHIYQWYIKTDYVWKAFVQ